MSAAGSSRSASLLSEMFYENSVRSDRFTRVVLICIMLIYLVSGTLNFLNIYETFEPEYYKVYFSLSAILITGLVSSWLVPQSMRKWFIFTSIVVSGAVCRYFFNSYASLIYTIPIFMSVLYYQRRFTARISVLAWLCFIASVVIMRDSFYAQYDLKFIILSVALPQTFVMALSAIIGIRTAGIGRQMILKQHKSVSQIAAMEQDIALSAKIQNSVLPPSQFSSADGNVRIKAAMFPAKEVAGDFFDYFMINKNIMVFLVADVSDKGVSAAMFMMQARNCIRYGALNGKNMVDGISIANKMLLSNNESNMFVTMWIAGIDIRTGVGRFLNAGHLPPIIKHADGSVTQLENDPDPFLGVLEDYAPRAHMFQLQKGDKLLLYTDGVTDALNNEGKSFELGRLLKVCEGDFESAAEMCDGVVESVQEFSGGTDPFDDMTVLALECNSDYKPKKFQMDLPAISESATQIMDKINEELSRVHCADGARKSVDIAIDEICTNIADYAYGGAVGNMEVNVELDVSHIKIEFADAGKAFNPLLVNEPKEEDLLVEGGLGIHFVKNLMDDVAYEYRDGKNHLTIQKIIA